MGLGDDLWMEQMQLADAVWHCNDSATMSDLMNKYALVTQKFLSIGGNVSMSRSSAVHSVLRFFLEQTGIADDGAVPGVHPVPSIESVAKLFQLFPPLKQYCEDMYLNDGIVGTLKYGPFVSLGHEIVLPALDLCDKL